mmetsp:Transcript_8713/g.18536  ORF Transcript_8713/g.18536 Transcript_8713/m.18536 type:complete len:371 (-) Transcript_8713:319-1431(-)
MHTHARTSMPPCLLRYISSTPWPCRITFLVAFHQSMSYLTCPGSSDKAWHPVAIIHDVHIHKGRPCTLGCACACLTPQPSEHICDKGCLVPTSSLQRKEASRGQHGHRTLTDHLQAVQARPLPSIQRAPRLMGPHLPLQPLSHLFPGNVGGVAQHTTQPALQPGGPQGLIPGAQHWPHVVADTSQGCVEGGMSHCHLTQVHCPDTSLGVNLGQHTSGAHRDGAAACPKIRPGQARQCRVLQYQPGHKVWEDLGFGTWYEHTRRHCKDVLPPVCSGNQVLERLPQLQPPPPQAIQLSYWGSQPHTPAPGLLPPCGSCAGLHLQVPPGAGLPSATAATAAATAGAGAGAGVLADFRDCVFKHPVQLPQQLLF